MIELDTYHHPEQDRVLVLTAQSNSSASPLLQFLGSGSGAPTVSKSTLLIFPKLSQDNITSQIINGIASFDFSVAWPPGTYSIEIEDTTVS